MPTTTEAPSLTLDEQPDGRFLVHADASHWSPAVPVYLTRDARAALNAEEDAGALIAVLDAAHGEFAIKRASDAPVRVLSVPECRMPFALAYARRHVDTHAVRELTIATLGDPLGDPAWSSDMPLDEHEIAAKRLAEEHAARERAADQERERVEQNRHAAIERVIGGGDLPAWARRLGEVVVELQRRTGQLGADYTAREEVR